MLGLLGLGYREARLNGQDRHQELQTKKACAASQRRRWHFDGLIVQFYETVFYHITPIMCARAAAVLAAFDFSPMRSIRCNQSRRL